VGKSDRHGIQLQWNRSIGKAKLAADVDVASEFMRGLEIGGKE